MARPKTRDEFTKGVRDLLAHRAGFRCSRPDCRASTAGPSTAPDGHGSIGIAAHITAAAPGGPRYDSSLSPVQRGSILNGIWLCDNHAREIDRDTSHFTAEVLRAWKQHAEDEARAMLGRPLNGVGFAVTLEVTLQRDGNDGLVVVGTTNLPDGTKLMGSLLCKQDFPYHGQAKCRVHDRYLLLGPFTQTGEPLPQRWYEVEVCSYFNGPWQQPEHVLRITGVDGEKLIGKLAQPLDPDLDETNYAVAGRFECPAPPLKAETPLSTEEVAGAVALLKGSVLDVESHDPVRSSEPVGEVVRLFMTFSGLREREGWNASTTVPGIVDVTYSYWDGERPAEAHWQVMPRSKQIRYRNRSAKTLSWSPED